MTPLRDRDVIRRILNADRVWSIYALADLDPDLFELCKWWTLGDALALVFTGISIRPVFVSGPASDVHRLLELLPVERGYLNLRDSHTPQSIYEYEEPPHRMHRMVLTKFQARPGETVSLGREHAGEIQSLYGTGTGAGVAFGEFQLDTGFFRGVRGSSGELISVAGVHVVSKAESVAGVGNIFTLERYRRKGLAQVATSAVTQALLDAGIETIGLNVEHNNAPAIAAYERLGYRTAFEYWEGTAVRAGARR